MRETRSPSLGRVYAGLLALAAVGGGVWLAVRGQVLQGEVIAVAGIGPYLVFGLMWVGRQLLAQAYFPVAGQATRPAGRRPVSAAPAAARIDFRNPPPIPQLAPAPLDLLDSLLVPGGSPVIVVGDILPGEKAAPSPTRPPAPPPLPAVRAALPAQPVPVLEPDPEPEADLEESWPQSDPGPEVGSDADRDGLSDPGLDALPDPDPDPGSDALPDVVPSASDSLRDELRAALTEELQPDPEPEPESEPELEPESEPELEPESEADPSTAPAAEPVETAAATEAQLFAIGNDTQRIGFETSAHDPAELASAISALPDVPGELRELLSEINVNVTRLEMSLVALVGKRRQAKLRPPDPAEVAFETYDPRQLGELKLAVVAGGLIVQRMEADRDELDETRQVLDGRSEPPAGKRRRR